MGSQKPSPRNFDALIAETRRLESMTASFCTSLEVCSTTTSQRRTRAADGLDQPPARQAGLGATPGPRAAVTPDWTFPSMADFAAAVDTE